MKELYDFKYEIYNEANDNIQNFKQINENQIILATRRTYNGYGNIGFLTRILLCDLEKQEIRKKPIITHNGKSIGESICKISEKYLAIGVYESIIIIDLKKLKKIKEYKESQCLKNLCTFNNYLICGSDKGTVYKYTINEEKLELKDEIKKDENYTHSIGSLIKLNRKTMVISQNNTIFIYILNEK